MTAELTVDPAAELTVDAFLNECHWPWAVEGLRTAVVRLVRGCRHEEVRELTYSTSAEELMELARRRCGDCQSKVDSKFLADAEQGRLFGAELGLPELGGGTQRQVAYANLLRHRAALRYSKAKDFLTVALAVADATWWIEHRSRTGHLKVFSELARELERQRPNE